MRFSAAILVLLIGFLIIQPALTKSLGGNFPIKKSCTQMCHMKKKCSKNNGNKDKGCSPDGCNPFMACAIGNYFLQSKSYQQALPMSFLATKIFLHNEKAISNYIGNCWHPPEFPFA